MQTGVGATACASGSQKWKGTAAALTSSPVRRRTKEPRTSASGGAAGVECGADVAHGEFAGAGVEQGDAHEHGVGAEGVDDAEGEAALDGFGGLDAVAGEGVGDDAHEFEEDEGVEEVAGEDEAAHAGLEEEDEGGEGARVFAGWFVEVAPGVDEDGEDEEGDQGRRAEGEVVGVEDDADAVSVVRGPAAEPFDDG